jgi:autoinducer 2-degrading protein
MYLVAVTVQVNPDSVDPFVEATLANARATREEPGNLRFDVLQAEEDPGRFLLYEAYRRREDFAAHQQTEHYQTWRRVVADWMAQPRQGIKHKSLFFGDEPTP